MPLAFHTRMNEPSSLTHTCSRSAAEIDELYERKIPAWKWSKTVTVAEEQMHAVLQVKEGEATKATEA